MSSPHRVKKEKSGFTALKLWQWEMTGNEEGLKDN